MRYSDIYSSDFLEKFGQYKNNLAESELDDTTFEVDLKEVARLCNIELEYNSCESSGMCDSENENRKIIVNQYGTLYQQRFTIAHEIGHIILGHKGISYRQELENYKDAIDRVNDIEANKFASELIMPEMLFRKALEKSMEELGYDKNDKFNDRDIDRLVDQSCGKLNVSNQLFYNRMNYLRIFVDNE